MFNFTIAVLVFSSYFTLVAASSFWQGNYFTYFGSLFPESAKSSSDGTSFFPNVYTDSGNEIASNSAGQLIFKTEEELVSSGFWKTIQKNRNSQDLTRYVFKVLETNSIYHLTGSEVEKSNKKAYFPDWLVKSERDIQIIEVIYGEPVELNAVDIPSTPCVSTELSSFPGSLSLSNSIQNTLLFVISPQIKLGVSLAGMSLATSLDSIDVSMGWSGGISCEVPPGTRAQIFSNINYVAFPNAVKRNITYKAESKTFEKGSKWTRIENSNEKFKDYGLVVFDTEEPPVLECIGQEEYLKCDEQSFDLKSFDPIDGLAFINHK